MTDTTELPTDSDRSEPWWRRPMSDVITAALEKLADQVVAGGLYLRRGVPGPWPTIRHDDPMYGQQMAPGAVTPPPADHQTINAMDACQHTRSERGLPPMTTTAEPPTNPVDTAAAEHHRLVGTDAYQAYVDAYDTAAEAGDPERHDLEAVAVYAGLAAALPHLIEHAATEFAAFKIATGDVVDAAKRWHAAYKINRDGSGTWPNRTLMTAVDHLHATETMTNPAANVPVQVGAAVAPGPDGGSSTP